MENVLKKIFCGNVDGAVHEEFIKYGKGEFRDKYLIDARRQKEKWSIKTSHEFTNFLVRKCLENAKDKLKVNGIIVSTLDLRKEKGYLFESYEKVKQFMGVKQLVVNSEREPLEILNIMEKYPKAFYALSFSTASSELKIKAKTPKNSKPSAKGGGEPKANFCSLKTSDKNIIEDLLFDFPDFNEIKVKHAIKIDKVILPEDVEDPVEIREKAKKKGIIIREVNVDGRLERNEKEFVA